ncbi:MAG: hypothetical protein PHG64_08860 [Paludibacter sp.]|nr:hypothetical protein [Paludibacter sp.]
MRAQYKDIRVMNTIVDHEINITNINNLITFTDLQQIELKTALHRLIDFNSYEDFFKE